MKLDDSFRLPYGQPLPRRPRPLREYNQHHEPGGSSKGGRFARSSMAGGRDALDAARTDLEAEFSERFPGSSIHVEGSELSVRAAYAVAGVLDEMAAKGYTLPPSVIVNRDAHESLHGDVVRRNGWSGSQLTITLPVNVPEHLDNQGVKTPFPLDTMAALAFGARVQESVAPDARPSSLKVTVPAFAVRTFADVVVHEMGHVQHQLSASAAEFSQTSFEEAALRAFGGRDSDAYEASVRGRTAALGVSRYATKSPREFVAEAFVRQYRGETLSPDAAALYRVFGGPKVRR